MCTMCTIQDGLFSKCLSVVFAGIVHAVIDILVQLQMMAFLSNKSHFQAANQNFPCLHKNYSWSPTLCSLTNFRVRTERVRVRQLHCNDVRCLQIKNIANSNEVHMLVLKSLKVGHCKVKFRPGWIWLKIDIWNPLALYSNYVYLVPLDPSSPYPNCV